MAWNQVRLFMKEGFNKQKGNSRCGADTLSSETRACVDHGRTSGSVLLRILIRPKLFHPTTRYKMKKNIIITIGILCLPFACTWVEPTLEGRQVKLLDQHDRILETCKKLGSVTTMVKHKVGFYVRSEEKVNAELVTIAQNEAVEMGGDTISAEGPAHNGSRAFSVYKCME
jgi:hypothetical protein